MNHIKLIPTFQRKKSIPKQLKDLELRPLNEQFSKLTMPIISDDDLRPVMMGNFFDMESKKIVSTDAHKLTAINMPKETYNFIKQTYNKELDKEPKGLIFHTLSQLQKDYNELLKIGVNENTGLQSFSEYAQRRIIEDGRYPNYDAVIPREFTNQINVDYQKLYWYVKVLLDAKVIDDKNKLNSSNETEYQNKKIEYLKDSYVSFINTSTRQIILTYTLDGEKQYIGFNAKFLCDILRFAMEYNGKYFGKVGISGNSRAMVIELENGLNATNDSIGLIMPVMIMNNDEYTIGQVDYDFNVKMYYDLDTNEINSDGVNYPIDESIGFKANNELLRTPKMTSQQGKMKKHTEMVNKVQSQQATTEVTSDNSYIDDIDIENKILIVAEKGKPLSTYKNGDKVFFADYSADKNWKLYVEGEVFIKDNEYSIKRFPQNITFKKYPLATFNSNTKVALKPNNEPIYSSDKTIKNNGVKNTQNDSMTFITNRIKGLKIALKVARAENKPKIQKRILGLEIAKKMQNPKYSVAKKVEQIEKTNNTNTYEDLLEQDRDLQSQIDEEKRKPKNEQSELKRLALEREVILRKIDEMEQFNKGGVVFTNYNGSEIMYEPNYDEYFVNDEVFDSMEDAKNYIDTGEMENDSYGFGGGLLVGSLVGGYLGYKIGKYNKQTLSSGFQTEKLIGKDIKNKLQGKKTYGGGGKIYGESINDWFEMSKLEVKELLKEGYVDIDTDKRQDWVRIAESDSIVYYGYPFEFDGDDFDEDNLNYYAIIKASGKGGAWEGYEDFLPLEYEYKSNKLTYKHPKLDSIMSQRKFDNGGGVDTISDEDLLRIKLAVAEAQDRINANQNESESGGSASDITNFIKENPQLLMLLEKGGSVGDENYEMLKNKVTELLHHSKELQAVVKKKPKTPAWVISKSSRASTDLSDITHYLEGKL